MKFLRILFLHILVLVISLVNVDLTLTKDLEREYLWFIGYSEDKSTVLVKLDMLDQTQSEEILFSKEIDIQNVAWSHNNHYISITDGNLRHNNKVKVCIYKILDKENVCTSVSLVIINNFSSSIDIFAPIAWSSDDRDVFMVVKENNMVRLIKFNINTQNIIYLNIMSTYDDIIDWQWSPSGEFAIFTIYEYKNNKFNTYILDIIREKITLLPSENASQNGWTNDNNLFFKDYSQIRILSTEMNILQQISIPVFEGDSLFPYNLQFSSDDTLISFFNTISTKNTDIEELFVFNISSGDFKKLVEIEHSVVDFLQIVNMTWSSSDKYLALELCEAPGPSLCQVNLVSSESGMFQVSTSYSESRFPHFTKLDS